jgi:hypothetical protein
MFAQNHHSHFHLPHILSLRLEQLLICLLTFTKLVEYMHNFLLDAQFLFPYAPSNSTKICETEVHRINHSGEKLPTQNGGITSCLNTTGNFLKVLRQLF